MGTKQKKAYFNMHVIDIESLKLTTNNDKVGVSTNPKTTTEPIMIPRYRYPPFFMAFISIFQLVTFVYYTLRSDEPITGTGPVPFNSKLIYNPSRRYEIWRFLTYGLIHTGYYHMITNLVIQLSVGIPLEILHSSEPISIIYVGGVISGALAHSVTDPHSYLAGASSGCYALIASHLANLIINWRVLKHENPNFKLLSLLFFIFTDFMVALYERHFKPGSIGWRTSYVGHFAGFIAGLLLGFIFLKRLQTHRFEMIAARFARYLFITYFTLGVVFNILCPRYFPLADLTELDWSTSPFFKIRE